MIHIGEIIQKASDHWADMPEIPKDDYNLMNNHERKLTGCLYVVVGLAIIFVSLSLGMIFLTLFFNYNV